MSQNYQISTCLSIVIFCAKISSVYEPLRRCYFVKKIEINLRQAVLCLAELRNFPENGFCFSFGISLAISSKASYHLPVTRVLF